MATGTGLVCSTIRLPVNFLKAKFERYKVEPGYNIGKGMILCKFLLIPKIESFTSLLYGIIFVFSFQGLDGNLDSAEDKHRA